MIGKMLEPAYWRRGMIGEEKEQRLCLLSQISAIHEKLLLFEYEKVQEGEGAEDQPLSSTDSS